MSTKENSVIVPYTLADALKSSLESSKYIYISTQAGWGKTTTVRQYFHNRRYTYVSLWDDNAIDVAIGDATGLVIMDDCHVLANQLEVQVRLTAFLRTAPKNTQVVLLSRAPLPNYLLSFQLAGLMTSINEKVFRFGTEDIAVMASDMGVELTNEDILRLRRESQGYPLAIQLVCLKLKEGNSLTQDILKECNTQVFSYLDSQLFSYWGTKIRRLLMSVSFFERFTVELARAVTGDNNVENDINYLCQISSFMDTDGTNYTIRYAPFRAYLRHKAENTWSMAERRALYSNAGTYFQLHGDIPAALECYARNGNHARVSEILAEHSRLHPGHGMFYKLRKYYYSLPEKEILSSPELMSGMSMLCSLTFDVEGSEKWYEALRVYAGNLNRRDYGFRDAWGLVHYLDIALPHRGSVEIKDLILVAADQLRAGKINLPEFSVTSNLPSILRGGKDFSSWVAKDRFLYNTVRKPVEMVLGRFGVGLGDIALTESRYEKGEDVTDEYLTLAARRIDIQQRGMPEMEFVLAAIIAKCQCDRGELEQAVSDIRAFRCRMKDDGHKKLLPNIDALLCRFDLLRMGEYAHVWYVEQAPDENDFYIMERYRYLTKARCYIKRKEYLAALGLLGSLLDCFARYDRTLDRIETLILLSVCRWRMNATDWRKHLVNAFELANQYNYVTVFVHEGAALLPLLRDMGDSIPQKILKRTQAFAALYPDYLAPEGPVSIQNLTKKEMEVLRLICGGKNGEEIRKILNISENTLKSHSRSLFKKMGVKSRSEARSVAERLHIV